MNNKMTMLQRMEEAGGDIFATGLYGDLMGFNEPEFDDDGAPFDGDEEVMEPVIDYTCPHCRTWFVFTPAEVSANDGVFFCHHDGYALIVETFVIDLESL